MSFFSLLTLHSCQNEVNCNICSQTPKLFYDESNFGFFYVKKTYFVNFTNTNEVTTKSVSNFWQKIGFNNFDADYCFFNDDNFIYIITQHDFILKDKNFIHCNGLIFTHSNRKYIMKNYFLFLLFCYKKYHLKIASGAMAKLMRYVDSMVHYYFESKDIFVCFFCLVWKIQIHV